MLLMFVPSVAVIVAGRPATGKSSALNTVVSTLNAIQGSDSSNIKLVKMYPDTYESLSDLYGCVSSSGEEWVDGIFTSAFRKAHKVSMMPLMPGQFKGIQSARLFSTEAPQSTLRSI